MLGRLQCSQVVGRSIYDFFPFEVCLGFFDPVHKTPFFARPLNFLHVDSSALQGGMGINCLNVQAGPFVLLLFTFLM